MIELAVMKQHAEIGHGILSRSDHQVMRCAANIAWAHHERWDGGGRTMPGHFDPVLHEIFRANSDAFAAIFSRLAD